MGGGGDLDTSCARACNHAFSHSCMLACGYEVALPIAGLHRGLHSQLSCCDIDVAASTFSAKQSSHSGSAWFHSIASITCFININCMALLFAVLCQPVSAGLLVFGMKTWCCLQMWQASLSAWHLAGHLHCLASPSCLPAPSPLPLLAPPPPPAPWAAGEPASLPALPGSQACACLLPFLLCTFPPPLTRSCPLVR